MKERTMVFWMGLILFCLAASVLFEIVWMLAVVMAPVHPDFALGFVPRIVGGIVFVVIGVVMMRSGRRKGERKDS